jgi:hypothetical protein
MVEHGDLTGVTGNPTIRIAGIILKDTSHMKDPRDARC